MVSSEVSYTKGDGLVQYKFVPMKNDYSHEISYNWRYSGIYSFYDMTADEEDLLVYIKIYSRVFLIKNQL